jgi:hypothetical protein
MSLLPQAFFAALQRDPIDGCHAGKPAVAQALLCYAGIEPSWET